jgi:hypothetical protein
LTSLDIILKNAEKIAEVGRRRWKIEKEEFNHQKNWQGDITHVCSWNEQAMKNHYLMMQISDMIKQLYEWYYLKRNEKYIFRFINQLCTTTNKRRYKWHWVTTRGCNLTCKKTHVILTKLSRFVIIQNVHT